MTFNSTVTNKSGITGSFTYDPSTGALGSTYTLSNGTGVSITDPSCNGNSVSFTVTTGGTEYNFHGAYVSNPSSRITGNCVSGPGGDDDPWVASGS